MAQNRSEEHTSELQSQSNIVCRLLLEKKNQTSFNLVFFFIDMATTDSYALSLHHALPICSEPCGPRCPCVCRKWSRWRRTDRKSTRLNSSHSQISYAVFCLKKKTKRVSIWCFFLLIWRPPIPTLFPYTTLFRSVLSHAGLAVRAFAGSGADGAE